MKCSSCDWEEAEEFKRLTHQKPEKIKIQTIAFVRDYFFKLKRAFLLLFLYTVWVWEGRRISSWRIKIQTTAYIMSQIFSRVKGKVIYFPSTSHLLCFKNSKKWWIFLFSFEFSWYFIFLFVKIFVCWVWKRLRNFGWIKLKQSFHIWFLENLLMRIKNSYRMRSNFIHFTDTFFSS